MTDPEDSSRSPRSALELGLLGTIFVLIVLSIADIGDPWVLVAAAVLFLVVSLIDGSLMRTWERLRGQRRQPRP